ncbi:MAG: alpha/beta hydrolase [Actinomycetota bacterium]|nr:alpha/beta hydrolase [Actinomycetota bacterium]
MPIVTTPSGTAMHYEVSGAGEPVVLVHGITESGAAWGSIADRLTVSRRVVVVDLPGHGHSGPAASYDVMALAADVAAVIVAEGLDDVRLVGHSLGGVVVSAPAAGEVPVRSVVNVDQSLKLDDFQAMLLAAEPALRDPESFPIVMEALLDGLAGDRLSDAERERLRALRRVDQEVVLGVWMTVLETPTDELAARVVELASAIRCPYLSLHGTDPGPEYTAWLTRLVPTATVETWAGLGHYPHLVDPDRFVRRLDEFWASD